jgi:hypothetical protein
MATVRIVPQTAEAHFVTQWDNAITLHRALPRLRKRLKEDQGIDNLQMWFRNPWGGPTHTEFSLVVELAKGATAATAAAVAKWLLDMGRDFVKKHKAKTNSVRVIPKNHRKRRTGKAMTKNRKRGR